MYVGLLDQWDDTDPKGLPALRTPSHVWARQLEKIEEEEWGEKYPNKQKQKIENRKSETLRAIFFPSLAPCRPFFHIILHAMLALH